ncbi:hypothetical protein HYALB_00010222 [Hymenoscyphus albidus]|uniref:Uncharacterized protein n=1 Tax=Hymenoscyphus albidus TaxID=595503 RepID=A0A9N9Q3F4_9HELO|nr:hypothetical protein HYALB_00010222 [Hymenoscyphus albidus]
MSKSHPINHLTKTDCQPPYFPTTRLSLLLTRFPTILFIGDETVRNLHTTLTILLHQDLRLGSFRPSLMGDVEKAKCACEAQYETMEMCEKFRRSLSDGDRDGDEGKGGRIGIEKRIKTRNIYLPWNRDSNASVTGETGKGTREDTIQTFQNLTSTTQNPWQPTPLLLSFPPSFSRDETVKALEEWCTLVREARRNIKVLYLPPPYPAAHLHKLARSGVGGEGVYGSKDDGERERYAYEKDVKELAERLKFEVLDLGALDGGGEDEEKELELDGGKEMGDGGRVLRRELERGMVFVGWLAFLESS